MDDYEFAMPEHLPSIEQYVVFGPDDTKFLFDREVDGVFIFKDADGNELHYGPPEKITGLWRLWQPEVGGHLCDCRDTLPPINIT